MILLICVFCFKFDICCFYLFCARFAGVGGMFVACYMRFAVLSACLFCLVRVVFWLFLILWVGCVLWFCGLWFVVFVVLFAGFCLDALRFFSCIVV